MSRSGSATPAGGDAYEVAGRGELQLGVLIENMRREGFELAVSRPRVVTRTDDKGRLLEPIEEIVIDVDDEFTGIVIDKLTRRKCELAEMKPSGGGKTRLIMHAPGARAHRLSWRFSDRYARHRRHEPLVPQTRAAQGRDRRPAQRRPHFDRRRQSILYALWYIEERGTLFIGHGETSIRA